MVGRTESRTKADDRRFELIREIGCLACNIEGIPDVPCQVHHELNDGGRRFDDEHRHTVGLCPWHHQGLTSGSVDATARSYGPSLAHHKRAFNERYGDRDARLVMQDSVIRIVESARRRNQYLPSSEMVELVRKLHREVVK